MKHIIIKSIAALALVGGITSCSDYLDTKSDSSLDDANIFASYDLAKGTITNIYTYFGEQNYRARHVWYGYNTDVEIYNSTSASRDGKVDLAVYDVFPNNNQIDQAEGKDLWSQLYKGVERSNLAIKGFENYANINDEKLGNLYGEALALRALTYLDLTNIWGDVPARWEPVTSETQYIARTPKEEIYAHILDDLALAEDYSALPGAVTETGSVERINKLFVKGLRARIALYAAGYSLHNDNGTPVNRLNDLTPYNEAYTTDGLYKIAYDECKEILTNPDYSKCYKLQKDFSQIFEDISQDKISNGRESMFEIGYANEPTARGRNVYTFGIYHKAADGMVGIKEQGAQVGPTSTLFFDYDKSDTRRDVTCIPYEWNAKGVQEVNNPNKWDFGKLRYEWMKRTVTGSDDGINTIVMRYSDIYLMFAEAANYLGNLDEAKSYIKQVMDLRYNDASVVNNKLNAATDKQSFLNLVINERGFEFAGEFLRKADLIRWGKLSEKLKETQTKMLALRSHEAPYDYLTGRLWMAKQTYIYDTGASGRSWSIAEGKLDFWGLNPGEDDTNVPTGYTEYTNSDGEPSKWLKPQKEGEGDDSFTLKIKNIYDPDHDPDTYMYWPIFQYNLNDNYALENYPWYNK